MGKHAILPERGSQGANCYDICSAEEYVLLSGERHMFETHVGCQLRHGESMEIRPRSKLANKFGIQVLAGEIDNDYRGELKVILLNTGDKALPITIGDAIAQLKVQDVITSKAEWIDNPTETERGNKGIDCKDLRL